MPTGSTCSRGSRAAARRARGKMSRLRSPVVGALLSRPLYLLLIDTFDTPELIAGARRH